jgi:hypothetical protein
MVAICVPIVIVGCTTSQPAATEPQKESTSRIFGGTTSSVRPIVPKIPEAIDITPKNGDVFEDRSQPITFAGFTTKAGETIDVQVLTGEPTATWVTIASTQSASTPTTFNDPEPIFRWSVIASPPSERWLPGGLLRYRAVVNQKNQKTLLPYFDSRSGFCVRELLGGAAATKSWKEVIAKCRSVYSEDFGVAAGVSVRAAALVAIDSEPADFAPPPYLSRKGWSSEQQTIDYYARIGAPQTLAEFEEKFGFFDNEEGEGGEGEGEGDGDGDEGSIEATYFNLGDLGIGREMHCTTFEGGTACLVKNYGVDEDNQPLFSGDAKSALNDAIARENHFATVAMVKFGNKFAPPQGNDVQFFVYNAEDVLANLAPLDNTGFNPSIPNNCLNCHGGRYEDGKVVGASFLPFDPEAFLFAADGEFSYAAQEEQFRRLNVLVRNSGAPPPVVQFVDGIYGGDGKADVPGTKANLDWIPKGWLDNEEAKTAYRELYKPYCRTCHISQVGDFAFMRFEDFKKESAKAVESVCKTKEMPIAEATLREFWRSPARAYFVNTFGVATNCAPSFDRGKRGGDKKGRAQDEAELEDEEEEVP